jgi:hypothetical protein
MPGSGRRRSFQDLPRVMGRNEYPTPSSLVIIWSEGLTTERHRWLSPNPSLLPSFATPARWASPEPLSARPGKHPAGRLTSPGDQRWERNSTSVT